MLLLEAAISFENVPFDVGANSRPGIDFGNGFSYSGILTSKDVKKFITGEWYTVDIYMITVDIEVFESIRGLVSKGCTFIMKAGNREAGRGKVIDFLYFE